MKQLTVGSLFSGIGGIEYGLERTGGFRTIWNCEIEAYPSAVLRKHWPDVPNLGDITKVDWTAVERPDLICGGFPCQDISIAGKGKGIVEGERSGLWREFARAIRSLRPRYALVENVPELANRGLWLVLADLAEMGYDAEWQIVSAASVGAPHRRERLFIIAYPNDNGTLRQEGKEERWGRMQAEPDDGVDVGDTKLLGCLGNRTQEVHRFKEFSWWKDVRNIADLRNRPDIPEPLICRKGHGISNEVDRIKCLGNAVVPQVAQVVGRMILEMEGYYEKEG
jgi:DNA (cytosine-5)-methyltransferase 1